MADNTFSIEINKVTFSCSSSGFFTAFGHTFDRSPYYTSNQPIEYFRAQLAFRGFSSRGKDVEALKERLKGTHMDQIDSTLYDALVDARHKSLLGKKRKADDGGEEEIARAAPAIRDRRAEIEVQIVTQAEEMLPTQPVINRPVVSELRGELLPVPLVTTRAMAEDENFTEDLGTMATKQREMSTDSTTLDISEQSPDVDFRLTEIDARDFLIDTFFNVQIDDVSDVKNLKKLKGKEVVCGVLELEGLDNVERKELHLAATALGLYNRTTLTNNVLVIGTQKDTQAQLRWTELNKAAGAYGKRNRHKWK